MLSILQIGHDSCSNQTDMVTGSNGSTRVWWPERVFSAVVEREPTDHVDDEKRSVSGSICGSSGALGTEKLCNAPQIIDKLPVLLVSLCCFRVPENRRGMNRHKDIRRNVCVPGFSLQLV